MSNGQWVLHRFKRRCYTWLIAHCALLLFAVSAHAANRYVRSGASGNGSGADWTNAYAALPAALVRGDTYYVADGTYAGYTFDDAASGTLLITLKKATVADHGTSLGWDDTLGDGMAVFTGQLNFISSYWLVDGAVGGGPGRWTSGFGFKVLHSGATALVRAASGSNITVRHIELEGTRNSSGGGSVAQDAVAVYGASNVTLSYFYTHAIGRCPFFLVPAPNIVIEYGYIADFVSTPEAHSEVVSAWSWTTGDLTFRHNLVTHIDGTGGIMWDNSGNHTSQARIYGNVFYKAPGDMTWTNANGLIGGWTGGGGEDCFNMQVYNNTFWGINQLIFTDFITRSGNNVVSNNLFYNSSAPSYADFQTHAYNHYINSGGIQSEPNGTTAAGGDPVVSAASLDFRLKTATPAGTTLSAPFTSDAWAQTRGADGIWDRGAFEFVSGAPPAVSACDINADGSTTVVDVQVAANQAIGAAVCGAADINLDGQCTVVDVQRVVNAALGGPCVTP